MGAGTVASSSLVLGTPRPASPLCCSPSPSGRVCFAGKSSSLSSSSTLRRAVLRNAQGLRPLSAKDRLLTRDVRAQAAAGGRGGAAVFKEEVFFDGGPHYGDLAVNILFGFTLVWLPLTLAAVFRNLFLRYRFTNVRVTIVSGLTGDDRKDFGYDVIKDVQVVPRFIGEWGDVVFTLKDGTKIDLRCVPRFRQVAKYCLDKAGEKAPPGAGSLPAVDNPKGFAS